MPICAIKYWGCTAHSLSFLIGVVFQYGAKPKVGRINACGTIRKWSAIVKHALTFRYCAEVNNPTRPMRFEWNLMILSWARGSRLNQTVSLGVFTTDPKPTMIRFINKFPKSFNEVFGKSVSGENRIGMKQARAATKLATVRDADKLVLHKSDSLICAALRAVLAASGHFYFPKPRLTGQDFV